MLVACCLYWCHTEGKGKYSLPNFNPNINSMRTILSKYLLNKYMNFFTSFLRKSLQPLISSTTVLISHFLVVPPSLQTLLPNLQYFPFFFKQKHVENKENYFYGVYVYFQLVEKRKHRILLEMSYNEKRKHMANAEYIQFLSNADTHIMKSQQLCLFHNLGIWKKVQCVYFNVRLMSSLKHNMGLSICFTSFPRESSNI